VLKEGATASAAKYGVFFSPLLRVGKFGHPGSDDLDIFLPQLKSPLGVVLAVLEVIALHECH